MASEQRDPQCLARQVFPQELGQHQRGLNSSPGQRVRQQVQARHQRGLNPSQVRQREQQGPHRKDQNPSQELVQHLAFQWTSVQRQHLLVQRRRPESLQVPGALRRRRRNHPNE